MSDADLHAYYERGGEHGRLSTWDGRLEFLRTLEVLDRYLPPAPAKVLDVGGGPGAYAVALTERGYDVELVDLVPLHVEQALAAGVAAASVGDARCLAQPDGEADAVLLLGPLYHLTDAVDRRAALDEARRVLRPGGLLAAAAISRFAPTFDGLRHGFFDDPAFEAGVARELPDGVHLNPDRRPRWFTTAYLHRPAELRAEVSEAGLDLETLVGVEGPAEFIDQAHRMLDDPRRRAILLRAIERVEDEPSLLGASAHLLAVARRPAV